MAQKKFPPDGVDMPEAGCMDENLLRTAAEALKGMKQFAGGALVEIPLPIGRASCRERV